MKKKDNKLKDILREINKKFGKNSIRFASEEKNNEKMPFGVKEIDEFIGGGIPIGKFTILYGSASTGKSTLAYTQIATLQKLGKQCVLIDMEHSFEKEYASSLGVDVENLLLLTATTAEEVMDIVIKLSKEKAVDYIALDSLQSLAPIDEMETKKGKEVSIADDQMAIFARRMGKFLRVVSPFIYRAKIGFLFIGQTRMTGLGTFFVKEGLSSGFALKHWASLILHLRKGQSTDAPTEKVDGKKVKVGFDCVIKIEKTKISGCKPENSELHIPFIYGVGFKKENKEEERSGME